jgi:hypothetical protein
MSSTLFSKREGLAQMPIGDWVDIRAAHEREAATLAAALAVDASLLECNRMIGMGDESAITPANDWDAISAAEARDRKPDLLRDQARRWTDHRRAVRAREALEPPARAKVLAARLPGRKHLIAELFDNLDAAAAASRKLMEYAAETARLLDLPFADREDHACADLFIGDQYCESDLARRRRLARTEGLLS